MLEKEIISNFFENLPDSEKEIYINFYKEWSVIEDDNTIIEEINKPEEVELESNIKNNNNEDKINKENNLKIFHELLTKLIEKKKEEYHNIKIKELSNNIEQEVKYIITDEHVNLLRIEIKEKIKRIERLTKKLEKEVIELLELDKKFDKFFDIHLHKSETSE